MRIVVAIDGDLLVPRGSDQGINGQRKEVARVIHSLSKLLKDHHELVITHGNAPQVGFMLLRAEAASHIVHTLPLDICGSDTQGATGYLLQQSLRNWFLQEHIEKEVVTLITQVVVDRGDPGFNNPSKGIGPFYDRDKALLYADTRGWDFTLIPGYGYRRAVPSLKPNRVIEVSSINSLLENNAIVICAGGGGIPVFLDEQGYLVGVDAVVDKAYTSSLLASQLGAEALLFISLWEKISRALPSAFEDPVLNPSLSDLDELIHKAHIKSEDLYNKLVAGRDFLQNGGQTILILPPDRIGESLEGSGGLLITPEHILLKGGK